jgi:hypothetical protein
MRKHEAPGTFRFRGLDGSGGALWPRRDTPRGPPLGCVGPEVRWEQGRDSRASFARQALAQRSCAANPRPPGYERGRGGRGFLNVLAMLRG